MLCRLFLLDRCERRAPFPASRVATHIALHVSAWFPIQFSRSRARCTRGSAMEGLAAQRSMPPQRQHLAPDLVCSSDPTRCPRTHCVPFLRTQTHLPSRIATITRTLPLPRSRRALRAPSPRTAIRIVWACPRTTRSRALRVGVRVGHGGCSRDADAERWGACRPARSVTRARRQGVLTTPGQLIRGLMVIFRMAG